MRAIEFAQLAARHREDVLGLDREAVHRSQYLVAVRCPVGSLAVNEYRVTIVRVGQRLVWKQGGHAELGVARQHTEHRVKLRVEAVFLPDTEAQFVGDLVAQRIGDDHHGLPVALPDDGPDVIGEELHLRAQCKRLPLRHGINLLLPGVAELVEVSVRVVLLHLDPERFERAGALGCAGGKVELPVQLVDAEPMLGPDPGSWTRGIQQLLEEAR